VFKANLILLTICSTKDYSLPLWIIFCILIYYYI